MPTLVGACFQNRVTFENVVTLGRDLAQRRGNRRKKPLRYSWALHYNMSSPEARELSEEGRRGLRYAKTLADRARIRSRLALFDQLFLPERLTVADLAAKEELSPIQIHNTIKRTRIELFGKDLTESAIYYRLKHRSEHQQRSCQHPNCDQPLSPLAPISRLYCDEHRKPRYRTRRHRAQQRSNDA